MIAAPYALMKSPIHPTLLLLLAIGCSPDVGAACLAGDTRACECPSGSSSVRLCDEGTFGACRCDEPPGGGGDASFADAGTGDAGSTSSSDGAVVDAPMRPTPTGLRASSLGYDPDDATAAFRAAIESDAPEVIIDGDLGSIWYVDPSRFTGIEDKTIFIEEGVTIQARPGRYDDPSAMIFRCTHCRNVRVYGYGATVRGLRDEEFNAEDMSGEWRHSFGLYQAESFLIEGVTIENSGGDAIYITGVDEPSRDVSIVNVTVNGARRQGISVISVDGLRVRGFACSDVHGRYPMAGIDFEPNRADEVLTDILLEDIRLERNGRAGVMLALHQMDADSTPVDITIRDLYLRDNWLDSVHYNDRISRSEIILSTAPRGHVTFENVYVDGSQQGFLYNRSDATGIAISFENVVARDMNSRSDSWNTIGLEVRDYSIDPLPMGNMTFTNFHISSARRTLLQVRGSGSGTTVLRDMVGEITYVGDYERLAELINIDGEENYTLRFVEASALPSRASILGW